MFQDEPKRGPSKLTPFYWIGKDLQEKVNKLIQYRFKNKNLNQVTLKAEQEIFIIFATK